MPVNFTNLHAVDTDRALLRFILRLLRHTPETAALSMQADGWVEKSALLTAIQCTRADCRNWSLKDLDSFVSDHNEFQRFAVDATRCRANYGHSTSNYRPSSWVPLPATLFHGTCMSNLEAIRELGLLPMGRLYVQITTSYEYASRVADQHKHPLVLTIHPAHHIPYLRGFSTGTHVWGSEHVPTDYVAHCHIQHVAP